MGDDLERLRALAARRAALQVALNELDNDRDDMIRAAAGEYSLREIADAVGLSFQRVSQIIKRTR